MDESWWFLLESSINLHERLKRPNPLAQNCFQDLGEDAVVHADYEDHRLVMIDLEDNVVVYVDYE